MAHPYASQVSASKARRLSSVNAKPGKSWGAAKMEHTKSYPKTNAGTDRPLTLSGKSAKKRADRKSNRFASGGVVSAPGAAKPKKKAGATTNIIIANGGRTGGRRGNRPPVPVPVPVKQPVPVPVPVGGAGGMPPRPLVAAGPAGPVRPVRPVGPPMPPPGMSEGGPVGMADGGLPVPSGAPPMARGAPPAGMAPPPPMSGPPVRPQMPPQGGASDGMQFAFPGDPRMGGAPGGFGSAEAPDLSQFVSTGPTGAALPPGMASGGLAAPTYHQWGGGYKDGGAIKKADGGGIEKKAIGGGMLKRGNKPASFKPAPVPGQPVVPLVGGKRPGVAGLGGLKGGGAIKKADGGFVPTNQDSKDRALEGSQYHQQGKGFNRGGAVKKAGAGSGISRLARNK